MLGQMWVLKRDHCGGDGGGTEVRRPWGGWWIGAQYTGRMAAALAGFYVVSAFLSNYGAAYDFHVLEVRPEAGGSLVRCIRIGPVIPICARTIIRAAERHVDGKSPQELAGGVNPCASSNRKIRRAAGSVPDRGSVEPITYGIVSQCGSSSRTLSLASQPDRGILNRKRPDVGALWDLMDTVTQEVFGKRDVFDELSADEDLAFQAAGEKLIPEIEAGEYDRGLKPHFRTTHFEVSFLIIVGECPKQKRSRRFLLENWSKLGTIASRRSRRRNFRRLQGRRTQAERSN